MSEADEARATAWSLSAAERARQILEVGRLVRDPAARRAFLARSPAPWTETKLIRAAATALAALKAESG